MTGIEGFINESARAMGRISTIPPPIPRGSTFAFGQSPFHTKGVLYLGTQSFFEANLQGGFAACLEEIDRPELRAFAAQKFLPSSLYDVMPVPALIAFEARALRMTIEQYLLHRTRWQAKKDLGGLHGWVLKLASCSAVVTRLPKVFLQMFDFGTVTPPLVDGNHALAFMSGIPQPLERWLGTALTIYAETALKLAGARGVETSYTTDVDGEQAGVPLVKVRIDVGWA